MKLMKLCVVVLMAGVVSFALTTSGIAEEKSWTYGGIEYKLPIPMDTVQIPPDHDVVQVGRHHPDVEFGLVRETRFPYRNHAHILGVAVHVQRGVHGKLAVAFHDGADRLVAGGQ